MPSRGDQASGPQDSHRRVSQASFGLLAAWALARLIVACSGDLRRARPYPDPREWRQKERKRERRRQKEVRFACVAQYAERRPLHWRLAEASAPLLVGAAPHKHHASICHVLCAQHMSPCTTIE